MQWTVERVKEELPTVRIQFQPDPTVYVGWVLGRKMPFASVLVGIRRGPRAHFGWETITRALNENTILQA